MATVVTVLLAGCHRHSRPADRKLEDDHDHEHEPKTAQITVWGERHEIFAEHRLAVAGTPTKFVTHVTDLRTLEPRREGTVRFQMRLGQEPSIEHVEKAPTRAGIYEATLTFPKAGEWQVTLLVPEEEGEKPISFPSVTVFPDAHEAAHAEVPEPPEGISFLKEQQWKIRAGTEQAAKRAVVEQLRLPAVVKPRPGSFARITPPWPGQFLLPSGKSMPRVGQKVEAGQALGLIQPVFSEISARFAEAEAEVVRTKLALDQAELTFKRIERLAKAEAKSGRELQETEFALRSAQARHEAALAVQAAYRQPGSRTGNQDAPDRPLAIELRSPIAGIVIEQSGFAVGEYVREDKALFTVLDSERVFIEAGIPEGSIHRLSASKSARYELQTGKFMPISGEGGGLVFLGVHVDTATRTVPLIYEVANTQHSLRVGQTVNLYVETARSEQTVAIPSGAIVEEDGRPIAFVQLSGETFERRDLELGISDGDWVQVRSGIAEGERVVSKGAYAVRLASVSTAIPAHGHVH